MTEGRAAFMVGGSGLLIPENPATRIYQGVMYHCSTVSSSIASSGNLDMAIAVAAGDSPHMVIEAACGGSAQLSLYEGVAFSSGTSETVFNLKRTSTAVWSGTMVSAPIVSDVGTRLIVQFMPGGSKAQAQGSAQGFDFEWICKPSTNYLLRLTNLSGATQPGSIGCSHYSLPSVADQVAVGQLVDGGVSAF